MKKVNCTICKKEMDCPENMLEAKVHVCNSCIDHLEEKDFNDPNIIKFFKEVRGTLEGMDKKLEKCDSIAKELTKMEFELFLKENKKIEELDKKEMMKKAFIEGSSSTLAFIMFGGMEEEFLDSMLEAIKEVNLHKQRGKK